MRIHLAVEQELLPINRVLLRKVLRSVARREGWEGNLSVAIVDDRTIQELNARFTGRDHPTDVLAFCYGPDQDGIAGEIVVSAETAQRVAASLDETPERELLRYCVHGLLHLCGYNDATPSERRRMEDRQEQYVRELCSDLKDDNKKRSGSP